MTWEIVAVYLMLVLTVVLFVSDRIRTDLVGLLILVALGLLGILEPKELLVGFGNEALITIAAMFVLSAALMRSGLVAALGGKLADLSRGSPTRFMVCSLLAVCFMSAFINNTPVVVVFIPAVLTVCARMGQSPSKFLMPISFASMLGGSCTLIGTSSNILVSSISLEAGLRTRSGCSSSGWSGLRSCWRSGWDTSCCFPAALLPEPDHYRVHPFGG